MTLPLSWAFDGAGSLQSRSAAAQTAEPIAGTKPMREAAFCQFISF